MRKLLSFTATIDLCSSSFFLNLKQTFCQTEKQIQVGWYYANIQHDYSKSIDW